MKRPVAVMVLGVMVSACHGATPTPTATTPLPAVTTASTPALDGPSSLSGLVSESTAQGARPLAGVSVNAWIELGTVGYSYWSTHGPVVTDDGRHYELRGLPNTATAWVQAWKDDRREYVQQCAAPPVVLHGDMHANVSSLRRRIS